MILGYSAICQAFLGTLLTWGLTCAGAVLVFCFSAKQVVLMNKMKEESEKYKDRELQRNKEIAQLQKEKLNKESKIKALQAEKRQKESLLKRRTKGIKILHKKLSIKHVSPKGAVCDRSGLFSPSLMKQKWQSIEKKINKLVFNKQSILTMGKDMNRWLRTRETLNRCLDRSLKKLKLAILKQKEPKVVAELEDEIQNLKANIEYVHENIADCQTSIMQMEEAKEVADRIDISSTLKILQLDESQYLTEKLLNVAINQSFQAAQKEMLVKELESQLERVTENNAIQEQLLLHVVDEANEHSSRFIELSSAADDTEHNRSILNSKSTLTVDTNK